ncbi:MAG: DUF423 domain-containing protein [Bacteroidetes bacterium]|nr:DUF423 domain-containing protein [Bacteroidota bacterium]MBS1630669.1 DUF423 domain-containing protein [Bacteroidota bacterium]
MYKPALLAGCFFAGLAVVLGAFGAHALKAQLDPQQLAIYEKGVTYQFYHSLALLAVGILFSSIPVAGLRWASWLFVAGIILFSGSLYLLAILLSKGVSIGPAGIITPIGGLCFISGWLLLLLSILKKAM